MTDLVFRRVERDPIIAKIMTAAEVGYKAHDKAAGYQQKRSFAPSTLVYGHGKCPRYWSLAFRGSQFVFDTDPEDIANMKSGTDAHARLQSVFEKSGILKQAEKKIVHDDPPVFGYMDVLFDIDGEEYPGEIKTSRPDAFDWRKRNGKGSDYHTLQLLIYLKILDLPKGFLIYENKETYELLVIPVELNDHNKAQVDAAFEWMRQVYAAYKDEKLPERGYRKNNKICKACPVAAACDAAKKGDVKIPILEFDL